MTIVETVIHGLNYSRGSHKGCYGAHSLKFPTQVQEQSNFL